MRISKKSIFGYAFLCGFVCVLGMAYINRPQTKQPQAPPPSAQPPASKLLQFESGIYVTQQIVESDIALLRSQGFATLIDLRPDGEAADQVPSAVVERAAQANKLNFFYIPVPHGEIPARAITALSDAIASSPRPILLYCRSGRRAARTLALAEASRPGGPDSAAILGMVKAVGQSADDLRDEIDRRIADRKQSGEERR